MADLYAEFVEALKKRYGTYNEETHKFESSSNTVIARELGYSDAQFSRLINGSATEGEYQRANKNLARIIKLDSLKAELAAQKKQSNGASKKLWVIATLVLTALCLFLAYLHFSTPGVEKEPVASTYTERDATIRWAFETGYVKPYVSLDDLPDDCNYPCYKYQGKWLLNNSYKLPFFREQNGYHYVATEVTMYARCMSEASDSGNTFEGYEYQKHEIWYDKRELPVDSFLDEDGQVNEDYKELDFSQDDNFVLVASVHTFFRNEFEVNGATISRSGKVIGRDLEMVPDAELSDHFSDDTQLARVKNNINRIATNRLEDFSKPVACDQASAPDADFNLIADGDIMSFSCRLTTSRLSLDYTKNYVLEDQYIKNSCRMVGED
ncbi:hypothetical protein AB9P05_24575 [Roseivirga sp. BDSF3-8]|uniref:hypothetical protein n=1 Tax=Roseivirga sp. BDSF3-8 TaxID=3241598 RepID=UPI003531B9E1